MEAKEAFKQILDSDEKIIESFRPRSFRFIIINIFKDLVVFLFMGGFGALFLFLSTLDGWTDGETGEPTDAPPAIIGWIIIGIAILIVVIGLVSRIVRAKKTWFCYTNKRILIRTGFIGVDYKTLDFDLIGAMDVRVDLLDKFVIPQTGTIIFASAASPMMMPTPNSANPYGTGYMFFAIDNPYDVYRRIKEYSSKNKDGKMMS